MHRFLSSLSETRKELGFRFCHQRNYAFSFSCQLKGETPIHDSIDNLKIVIIRTREVLHIFLNADVRNVKNSKSNLAISAPVFIIPDIPPYIRRAETFFGSRSSPFSSFHRGIQKIQTPKRPSRALPFRSRRVRNRQGPQHPFGILPLRHRRTRRARIGKRCVRPNHEREIFHSASFLLVPTFGIHFFGRYRFAGREIQRAHYGHGMSRARRRGPYRHRHFGEPLSQDQNRLDAFDSPRPLRRIPHVRQREDQRNVPEGVRPFEQGP